MFLVSFIQSDRPYVSRTTSWAECNFSHSDPRSLVTVRRQGHSSLLKWYSLCFYYTSNAMYVNNTNNMMFSRFRWRVHEPFCEMGLLCHLTHCGLLTPYGDMELVNIGSGNGLLLDGTKPLPEPISVGYSDIHRRAISKEIFQPSVTKISWKITYLIFF